MRERTAAAGSTSRATQCSTVSRVGARRRVRRNIRIPRVDGGSIHAALYCTIFDLTAIFKG